MKIEYSELVYILISISFIMLFFGGLYYFNVSGKIDNLNPVFQFLIINIGMYLILFVIIKAIALQQNIIKSLQLAFGSVLLVMACDILLPAYHITFNGILQAGGLFGKGASDYFFGYLGSIIGIKGMFLFGFVYILIPLVFMTISAVIFKNFVKEL